MTKTVDIIDSKPWGPIRWATPHLKDNRLECALDRVPLFKNDAWRHGRVDCRGKILSNFSLPIENFSPRKVQKCIDMGNYCLHCTVRKLTTKTVYNDVVVVPKCVDKPIFQPFSCKFQKVITLNTVKNIMDHHDCFGDLCEQLKM